MSLWKRFTFFLTGFIIGLMILYYSSIFSHEKILNNIKKKKIIFNKENIQKCKKKSIFRNPIFIKSKLLKEGKIILIKKILKDKPFPIIYHIEIREKNKKKIFIIEEKLKIILIKKFYEKNLSTF
ncbi:MAG: hypothetical protein LBQ72_00535 [Flavobacteriales bacterium]|nr:hypothetical protein MADAR_568 [Blattabacterium sp. (Mastotermes darwiniensis) str. MADAR]MDR1804697.1 hypothetical protein [Flavobacteriales bacterium]